MLEGIIRFSLKQRIIVILGTVALFLGGIYCLTRLPIEAFPDVLNETVQVITLAPGQSAQDVEKKITAPLEREFSGIPHVVQSRSVSEFGLSVIYLYFDDGVDKYWARAQTLEKIPNAVLPPNVQPGLAPLASVTGEILRYEIKGSGYSSTALRTIEDWILEKEFRSVPGIADVVSYGGKVKTWDVLVDPLKLATFGISIRQVADTLQNANSNAGGNQINWPNQSFVVRSDGEFRSMADIGDVGVSQRGNSIIRVKDIAVIQESSMPVRGVVGRDGRDDIVQGIVLLRKGENPVVVGELLRHKVDALNKGTLLPEGVTLQIYYDRLNLVEKTTKTVGKNLLEGLLLVCLVLYLFLRNKYATGLVAIIVPLSLLFAFTAMVLTGTPANLISLGSIDFGIVVDGAVIIVEYVLRRIGEHRAAGGAPIPTSPIGKTIAEVVVPVFFSMGMIILAYLPIFTLQRVEGKMFSPLAWTVTFTLLGALVLSLTLVPALLPTVLEKSAKLSHVEPRWLKSLHARYRMLLRWTLLYPRKFSKFVLVVVAAGFFSFYLAGVEFLPELDEGALWIRATFPHSTSIEEGVKLARQIRMNLKTMDEVHTVVSQLGGPEDGTDPNLFDNCEFFIDLKPKEQWHRFHHEREELENFVRRELAKFPGIDFNVSQPIADNVEEALSGVKARNVGKIYGSDLKVLDRLADQYMNAIKNIRGLVDVSKIAITPYVPHLTVRVDRAKVAQSGLNLQDLNDLIEIAVGGKAITQVYENDARLSVIVRAPHEFRSTLEDIRNLPVALPGGAKTKLDRLATVEMESAPQAIFRENGYRRIGVKFNVENRDLGSIMKEVLDKAKSISIPAGYFVRWGGEYENESRAMSRLLIVIPTTILLLGVVLFILFDDLWVVGAVLLTLFLSVTGSGILLALRQIPFSVSAAVGLLALFGVVTLNNVTLVSQYQRLKREHPDRHRMFIIRQACDEQFKSILMTSILALLGLLPAAFSHGIGAETQRPLATAVVGGILTSFPSIMLILPVLLLLQVRQDKKLTKG